MRTPEINPTFVPTYPVEGEFGFQTPDSAFNHGLSDETIINAGVKVAGAAIFTVGIYKVITADSLADLAIGGFLMYFGYIILSHQAKNIS